MGMQKTEQCMDTKVNTYIHTRSAWRCLYLYLHLYTPPVFCRFFSSFCCVWDVSEGQPFGSGHRDQVISLSLRAAALSVGAEGLVS